MTDLPVEMTKTIWREDRFPGLAGLSLSDADGWRLLATLPPGLGWQSASYTGVHSRDVVATVGAHPEAAAFFVSVALFATQECCWPPIGISPGVLDFDWAEQDWDRRDPLLAVARVRDAMGSEPLSQVAGHFLVTCSGRKGLHIIYDCSVLPTNPRCLREQICDAIPTLGDSDHDLYLDLPHWFYRVPSTTNYFSVEGRIVSWPSRQLDVTALTDGRLERALAAQWGL